MPITEYALSLDAPGMETPGLITGRLTITASGLFTLEYVTRAADEGTAFAHALRLPTEAIANAVMDYLVRILPPGGSLRLVEITRGWTTHELAALQEQGMTLTAAEAHAVAEART